MLDAPLCDPKRFGHVFDRPTCSLSLSRSSKARVYKNRLADVLPSFVIPSSPRRPSAVSLTR